MGKPIFAIGAVLAAWLWVPLQGQQPQTLLEKIGPNAYEAVPNWALPYPKAGYAWGSNPGVFVESPNRIFVAMTTEIVKFDTSGKRLFSWDASGTAPGGFGELHELALDSQGTVYTADNVLGRLQKLRPKPGADPSQLIGPPMPLMPKAP